MTSLLSIITATFLGLFLPIIAIITVCAYVIRQLNSLFVNPELRDAVPETTPGVPLEKVRALAQELERIGFRHLLSFEVPSGTAIGMNNFSMIHVNQAGLLSEIHYIRCPMLIRIITLICSPKNFHTSTLGLTISTVLSDNSRLAVATCRHSAANIAPRDKFVLLPDASPQEALERLGQEFQKELAVFATQRIQSRADFERYFKARMALALAQSKRCSLPAEERESSQL
ncbi:MAG: hypothetical protein QY326_05205 [Bdellovibrionota bacterium]|nr:MAG: hypothetical protein QY326_05205 [Bdellovibrionota bacterium]